MAWRFFSARKPLITMDRRSILTLNIGSSTVKFAVFPAVDGDEALLEGVLEISGSATGELRTTDATGRRESRQLAGGTPTAALLHFLTAHPLFASVQAVGHRLVHGGPTFRKPVRVDAGVRALLEEVIPFAPQHLPAELRAIDEVSRAVPQLTQVACFDTTFHGEIPAVARLFGLPRQLANSGVVRFGFHGLSYEYVTTYLREHAQLAPRTLVAHLGNGASIAAVLDGVCIDTSMGMTPSGGLVMATRSGDLDPGVMLYLLRSRSFSADDLDEAVNRNGGMLGISESSSDVRRLLAASPTDTRAKDAIDVFCYQTRKFIGAYAAVLGGIDALVFTGGIGEHSPEVRWRICENMTFLGLDIDPDLNRANAPAISRDRSGVVIRVVRSREDVMIARHVRESLSNPSH